MLVVAIGLTILVADQITKQWVRYSFDLGESRPVLDGFFDLTYVRNPGAAWGMFRDFNGALVVLSVVMLILLIVFRRSFISDTRLHRVALGLMIGGILGNLMDRIRLSSVTDFLDFYIGNHHWPAFNIADSAICVGVGIYIVSAFWTAGHPLNESMNGRAPQPPEPAPEPGAPER
jgi:signal peptidase II